MAGSRIPGWEAAQHKIYSEYECSDYDERRFLDVVNTLIKRHDMLRCQFDDSGYQRIIEKVEIENLKLVDISDETDSEKQRYMESVRKRIENQFLDYHKAPLASLEITKYCSDKYSIYFYVDALIADGWSHEILVSEANRLYCGELVKPEEFTLSYRDYAVNKRLRKETEAYQSAQEYWKNKMNELPGVPEIPLLQNPDLVSDTECFQMKRALSNEAWERVEQAAESMGVTPFIVTLTAFCKVLARYSKAQSFTLNIPFVDRPAVHDQMNSIVGMCSSFFLFDYENKSGETMEETAKRVQSRIWELKEHSIFEGSEVVREFYHQSGVVNEFMATIVFTSLIDVPYGEKKTFKKSYIETHTSQIWLDAVAFRDEYGVSFNWDCVESLLDKKLINDMSLSFIGLLLELAEANCAWDKREESDFPEEELEIIESVNATEEVMTEQSINELLIRSFQANPDNIALADGVNEITYQKLEQLALQLSNYLGSRGIKKGDAVAIVMEKGWHQIVAAVGILFTGAVYVPLESEMPAANIKYCLKKIEAKAVITDSSYAEKVQQAGAGAIINFNMELFRGTGITEYQPAVDAIDDVFAVIHTSGSTGHPKGIYLSQRGLINSVLFTNKKFDVNETDAFIALTNLCHDMSLYDIFGGLFAGATIVVPGEKEWKDPEAWVRLIEQYQITIHNSVPALFEMLIENYRRREGFQLPTLRLVILGGAFLRINTARDIRLMAPNCTLVNVGGPSETTLWSIYHIVDDSDIKAGTIPYGRAISNIKHYILNDNMELCPIGVKGVMCTEGVGVAKGYVGLPEEESKRFVMWHGKRIYITGDMGYYLPDGEIGILGREDDQIKINGKRIELKGIEHIICENLDVSQCVVVTNKEASFPLAYYVSDTEYTENQIKAAVRKYLPEYMVPKYCIGIPDIPLTRNGKVDTNALPDISAELETIESAESRDDLDMELIEQCNAAIGGKELTIKNNFFMSGGDSLGLIKILAYIRENYDIELSIAKMFGTPTIEAWHDMIVEKIMAEEARK